VNSAASPSG